MSQKGMKRVAKNALDGVLAAIAAKETLYLPVDNEKGEAVYRRYTAGVPMSRAANTLRSAKDFFFPQTENLMDFKLDGKSIEVIDTRVESEDFVIFGVRACDAAGFAVLDRVFLSDPVDTYYENRRRHATVVTLACARPEETCFCTTYGIDPALPGGDVRMTETESYYTFEALTEKGEALLDALPMTEAGGEAETEAARGAIRAIAGKLPLRGLTTDGFGAGQTDALFERPEWASLAECCLGCGTCTYVCPTCQCYDIRDFDTGHGIQRFRCWDSCMVSDFTKMSAGQPRPTQKERFRQRFMHKLVYFPENNEGVFGCVGCGRCLMRCPVSLHIVKVMKTLGGKQA